MASGETTAKYSIVSAGNKTLEAHEVNAQHCSCDLD